MENPVTIKQSIIKEFEFNYQTCSISENKIIELFGYDAVTIPEPVFETIRYILNELPNKVRLQSGFKIFNFQNVKLSGDKFTIDNITFNCGKIIYSSLKNSDTMAFIISSIGGEIEKWSKYFMDKNEILKGYIIDKVASELVEELTDKTESLLEKELENIELKSTNRYSPGYCGWSVADQKKLFSLLPEMFCGVSINDNSMMIPIKSVSAVVGIGKHVERRNYDCSICDEEFCYKRKSYE